MTARWHVTGLGRWETVIWIILPGVTHRPGPVKLFFSLFHFHRSWPMRDRHLDDHTGRNPSAMTGEKNSNLKIFILEEQEQFLHHPDTLKLRMWRKSCHSDTKSRNKNFQSLLPALYGGGDGDAASRLLERYLPAQPQSILVSPQQLFSPISHQFWKRKKKL